MNGVFSVFSLIKLSGVLGGRGNKGNNDYGVSIFHEISSRTLD